jgi:hypothetical protein
MLISALLFVFSFATTIKFAIFSWRAGLLRLVADTATNVADASTLVVGKDFADVSVYQELCPSLEGGAAPKLGTVSLYHRALKLVGSAEWAKSEMALCTSYATAVLTQRMERNQTVAAEVCSF